MTIERGNTPVSTDAKNANAKANGFFGTLKDALMAAGRDELPSPEPAPSDGVRGAKAVALPPSIVMLPATLPANVAAAFQPAAALPPRLSAEDAARMARAKPADIKTADDIAPDLAALSNDAPPTTRVVRRDRVDDVKHAPRTQLVRGRQAIARGQFERDPVVGFLVIVGGPGLGGHRAIYEGNNTIGRSSDNRIALDFGDEAISSEAQAYVRYDSNDRSFLFVPNLAKTNVVSVNDKRPTAAVELKAMDVITVGRTQVAFVPFCGADFDWSEISDT